MTKPIERIRRIVFSAFGMPADDESAVDDLARTFIRLGISVGLVVLMLMNKDWIIANLVEYSPSEAR
ncbi:hypothetical protein JQC91_16925 [Jannaschia sp. Os4]|uniref:hypothetical protein n=1 Tax=Jannaschia sp. Os4 TaxID=2807617 RepID=UPI001939BDC4|nr:hypothetical protein [Jannaschia sp. Os4]MBM2577991.1 hypothetical protein [Jannaschia sp. Os4]